MQGIRDIWRAFTLNGSNKIVILCNQNNPAFLSRQALAFRKASLAIQSKSPQSDFYALPTSYYLLLSSHNTYADPKQ